MDVWEMGRQSGGKARSVGRVVVLVCLSILAFAVIADLFWASSSKFTPSYFNNVIASDELPRKPFIIPNNNNNNTPKVQCHAATYTAFTVIYFLWAEK